MQPAVENNFFLIQALYQLSGRQNGVGSNVARSRWRAGVQEFGELKEGVTLWASPEWL